MMKKLKKAILPIMLGMFLCGGVTSSLPNVEENQVVYAADKKLGDANELPKFTMKDGKVELGDMQKGNKTDFFNTVFEEYRTTVTFISGVALITMIIFFIMNFIALGKSQGNPQERQKAISGLIMSGIACAGLGSVTLIVSLFYGML